MSEIIVVLVAIVVALTMAIKPEMFILNEAHRSPQLTKGIKYIGISVSIVLLAMFLAEYIF